MVKIININKNLKDELKNIRWWKRMDEEDFKDKHHVSLKFSNTDITNKFNISGSLLQLEYVISMSKTKFISYSKVSSMYDVDKLTLLKIAKENGFMIMKLPPELDFENDVTVLARKLISSDMVIIPLDDAILVQSDEEIQINFDKKRLFVKKID